jgi:hypothetical protein
MRKKQRGNGKTDITTLPANTYEELNKQLEERSTKYKGKVDLPRALQLRLKGATVQEIGQVYNVSGSAITQLFARYLPPDTDLDKYMAYKNTKTEQMEMVQQRALHMLTSDKLQKASVGELNALSGTLEDKIRLQRGQSTSNTVVAVVIESVTKAIEQGSDIPPGPIIDITPAAADIEDDITD